MQLTIQSDLVAADDIRDECDGDRSPAMFSLASDNPCVSQTDTCTHPESPSRIRSLEPCPTRERLHVPPQMACENMQCVSQIADKSQSLVLCLGNESRRGAAMKFL